MYSQNYKLEIVDPRTFTNWNSMIQNSSDEYTIFHTSNWSSVLSDSYGFRACYFAIIEGDRFIFLLPIMEVHNFLFGKKGICLPFTDYCNPIINNKVELNDLLPQLISAAQKYDWKSIQIRDKGVSLGLSPPSSYYYRHRLELQSSEETMFRKFRENYKTKIKKALKQNNVNVNISKSLQALEDYYQLHCLTRKRQGMPPQPFSYFKNIYTHIIEKNLGFVSLASINNEKIAGAVFFHFGGKAVYKYGASNLKYKSFYANYLVIWEAVRWLCGLGCTELCFGRTDPLHQGLIQFKDGWGTEKHQIYYYKYNVPKETLIQEEQKGNPPGYNLLRLLPVTVLRTLGSMIYRYGA